MSQSSLTIYTSLVLIAISGSGCLAIQTHYAETPAREITAKSFAGLTINSPFTFELRRSLGVRFTSSTDSNARPGNLPNRQWKKHEEILKQTFSSLGLPTPQIFQTKYKIVETISTYRGPGTSGSVIKMQYPVLDEDTLPNGGHFIIELKEIEIKDRSNFAAATYSFGTVKGNLDGKMHVSIKYYYKVSGRVLRKEIQFSKRFFDSFGAVGASSAPQRTVGMNRVDEDSARTILRDSLKEALLQLREENLLK